MSNRAVTILFNAEKFLAGTMFFTNEQVGKYMRALCAQQLHGHLEAGDLEDIIDGDKKVLKKFKQDQQGLYYNERMDKEVKRSATYSESQSTKARKRWGKEDELPKSIPDKNLQEQQSGIHPDYKIFKHVYPADGSAFNPEVNNWFILHAHEVDTGLIMQRASEYADYWKARSPDSYPHSLHMKQAINWLRQAQFNINWKAKAEAEKKEPKNGKKAGIL